MNYGDIELGKVDLQILSLFPSLDFNRPNIHAQSKKGMKRSLFILKQTAETGYITKYMLTNERSQFRMGGQSAHDGLKSLVQIGLLHKDHSKTIKKTERNDHTLTSKGAIACLVFPEFQKKHKFGKILSSSKNKENELFFTLNLFNQTFVRGRKRKYPSQSPLTILIKEMVEQGFNLELKSEKRIVQDIRMIEENKFLGSLNVSQFDFVSSIMFDSSNGEESNFETLVKVMNENASNLKELRKIMKENPNESEIIKRAVDKQLKGLMLFFTSQEFYLWKEKYSSDLTIQDLSQMVEEKISQMGKSDDPLETFTTMFPLMHQTLRDYIKDAFQQDLKV